MLAPADPYDLADCAVCHEPFDAVTRQSMVAQCQHRFHSECLDRWEDTRLTEGHNPTCPLCNGPMYNDYSTVIWRPGIERVVIIEPGNTGVMHYRYADGTVRKATAPSDIAGLTTNIMTFLTPPGLQLSSIVFERRSLERVHTLHHSIVKAHNRCALENAVRVYTCERYVTHRQQSALYSRLDRDAPRAAFAVVTAAGDTIPVTTFVRHSYGV